MDEIVENANKFNYSRGEINMSQETLEKWLEKYRFIQVPRCILRIIILFLTDWTDILFWEYSHWKNLLELKGKFHIDP